MMRIFPMIGLLANSQRYSRILHEITTHLPTVDRWNHQKRSTQTSPGSRLDHDDHKENEKSTKHSRDVMRDNITEDLVLLVTKIAALIPSLGDRPIWMMNVTHLKETAWSLISTTISFHFILVLIKITLQQTWEFTNL